jgi:hypothetical protein
MQEKKAKQIMYHFVTRLLFFLRVLRQKEISLEALTRKNAIVIIILSRRNAMRALPTRLSREARLRASRSRWK